MSPVCKMADNRRLTVDQMVKVVLFYAETKRVVATQRRFRARFGTRWAHCKQIIYRLSLGTIFQPMRINSVPDVKCFCNNKMYYVYNQWYGIPCATLYNRLHGICDVITFIHCEWIKIRRFSLQFKLFKSNFPVTEHAMRIQVQIEELTSQSTQPRTWLANNSSQI